GSVNPSAFDEIHRACNDIPVRSRCLRFGSRALGGTSYWYLGSTA
ncbi:unnamed protein product, partial [Laminaria digitata]